MKRTPQVVPPPSKAVQDQLSGVQQIHPTETDFVYTLPSFLSYGPALPYGCRGPSPPRCPYPPRRKSTVKPSMAPHLKAVEDKPSCQQGGWNGEDWKDWNDSSVWSQDSTWNSWNSKEEWVQDERYQEKDMVEDSHTDANQKASFDGEYEYVIEEQELETPFMVEVGELRFSQLSCGKRFQNGRPVSQLVRELLKGKVSLSDPFLRLTVYEDTDSDGSPILKCIDNRRLLALKEYARRSGKEVMVNVEYFSHDTVKKVKRIIRNSDNTDGREVRLRCGRRTSNNKKRY